MALSSQQQQGGSPTASVDNSVLFPEPAIASSEAPAPLLVAPSEAPAPPTTAVPAALKHEDVVQGALHRYHKYDPREALRANCILVSGGDAADRKAKIKRIIALRGAQSVWEVNRNSFHNASPQFARSPSEYLTGEAASSSAILERIFERKMFDASHAAAHAMTSARCIVVFESVPRHLFGVVQQLAESAKNTNMLVVCSVARYLDAPTFMQRNADVLVAHHERSQESTNAIYKDWGNHVARSQFRLLVKAAHLVALGPSPGWGGGDSTSATSVSARGDALVYQYSKSRDLFSIWVGEEEEEIRKAASTPAGAKGQQ